jgi:tetratricopeptide (TPR) repeat protein
MKNVLCTGLWLSVALLALESPVRGQDRIRHADRKTGKETAATGTIQEESPSQVVYKPATGTGTREIPALDILDIIYEVPPAIRFTYRSADAEEKRGSDLSLKDAERKKAYREAIKNYEEILPRLQEGKLKFAERHARFKIARLLARQAEEDPEQVGAAMDALAKFKERYSDGWQITPCAKILARLQLARGDTAAAQKTYEELAATANIPDEVRKECDLLIADALLRGKKYAEAQNKLETALKAVSADDPQATRIRIYLAECQGVSGKLPEAETQLQGIIAKTAEKDLKALAYNVLGDCYRLNGRNRDALWPYLWVDVVYHQDRQEHVKAMEQLARLFEEQGDKARAKQYRDRLKKEAR